MRIDECIGSDSSLSTDYTHFKFCCLQENVSSSHLLRTIFISCALLFQLIVKGSFVLFFLLLISLTAFSQDEGAEKAGLLMERCAFEPDADIMVLKDEATIAVNNDFSIRLERRVTYKFFKEKKIDKQLSDAIFYPSPFFEKYYRLNFRTVELDPTTKALIPRDHASKVTSTHLEQSNMKIKSGALLEVSYFINFPYDEKIPDWRFQSVYPTEFSSIKIETPDAVEMKEVLEGNYKPEVQNSNESIKQIRLDNQTLTLKVSERYYQLNQLPSSMPEPFADHSRGQLARMRLRIASVTINNKVKENFVQRQIDHIVESLSTRADFYLRLNPPLNIKGEFDRRIKSVSDPKERMIRIYDLVRRHITWNRVDSLLAGHALAKVWNDKRGNSTEINLVLIKLFQVYGYDVSPLIVSTRTNGPIDTDEVALSDFNRTVADVRWQGRSYVFDATGQFYDYPSISASILNTTGLLISPDSMHWIAVKDTHSLYRNAVTLLGHLSGDTSFLTNVYVNSWDYAKPEHVDIMETDSMRGLRRYFERGNKKIQLKHFIAANEWVDTLPLAQEFDIRVPLEKNDNLAGMVPTWFSIPDTLFTITEDRKCDVNFGYRQEYDLVSDFTFPDNYEIYLLPNRVLLTALNGSVRFEREYHPGVTDFSLRQTLVIDRSYFNKSEALELARFLKKVAALNSQQVTLKKNFIK
jgi:hypothetical protein